MLLDSGAVVDSKAKDPVLLQKDPSRNHRPPPMLTMTTTTSKSKLHTFKLADTLVTDIGCHAIACALGKQLQTLHVFKCNITDVGLEAIAEYCVKLQELDAHDLKGVTDRSATALAKVASLKRMYLSGTSITSMGLEQLLDNRPEVMRLEANGCVSNDFEHQRVREAAKAALQNGLQLVL
ncbi:unnamed protein product [Amoebophrya sp. A25]|nr:unnamed protein product [Amoebophrya sp. A25]|eukprot:GSA25T00022224001.1